MPINIENTNNPNLLRDCVREVKIMERTTIVSIDSTKVDYII